MHRVNKKIRHSIAGLFTAAFDNESSTLPWQRFASVMAASVVFKFLSDANVFRYLPHYEGDDIN